MCCRSHARRAHHLVTPNTSGLYLEVTVWTESTTELQRNKIWKPTWKPNSMQLVNTRLEHGNNDGTWECAQWRSRGRELTANPGVRLYRNRLRFLLSTEFSNLPRPGLTKAGYRGSGRTRRGGLQNGNYVALTGTIGVNIFAKQPSFRASGSSEKFLGRTVVHSPVAEVAGVSKGGAACVSCCGGRLAILLSLRTASPEGPLASDALRRGGGGI